jgi:sterol desaturase/sphingolipid hydroxylase (fatty acid hydroxylase superfamily)
MGPLLGLNIIDGTAVVLSSVVSVVLVVLLLLRLHPKFEARSRRMTRVVSRRRWIITVAIAALSGAVIAVITLWLTESVFNVFGLPLDPDTRVWVVACFAAIANAAD